MAFSEQLSESKWFKRYTILVFVIILAISISAGIHTYLNYNEPSPFVYYVLSFIMIFFETVSISSILAGTHEIVNQFVKEKKEEQEGQRKELKQKMKELVESFNKESKEYKKLHGKYKNPIDIQRANEFTKRAMELEKLLDESDNMSFKEIKIETERINEEFSLFLEETKKKAAEK